MNAASGTAAGGPAARVLNVAIAGLGIGGGQVIPALERMPEVRLAAAADLRQAALDVFQRRYDARVYTSVADLCADPDVDVVWVATPNNLHCEHVIMAAEHGKHVVCEKPMALSVAECEHMVEAAEKNGVKLVCGHTYSLHPAIQAMRGIITSGQLGRLCALNALFYTDWLLKPRMPEELDLALGGGVVYRHGPHVIDTVRLLGGGRVRSVRAMVGQWMPGRACPGNYSAFLEFEDGVAATVCYNGYGYFYTSELTWGIGNRLYTDDERVRVRQALGSHTMDVEREKEAMRFGADPSLQVAASDGIPGTAAKVGDTTWFGIHLVSCERGDVRQSPNGLFVYDDQGQREIPVERRRSTGSNELRELYDALTQGTPIAHDGRWGMATLEVLVSIMQSGRERREIMLSHQCPAP